ncbi:MAG TPA: SRPBCC family protein [Opitutus sp.]|nr:SRPBCC family protein [Opitutus sp.]
MRSTNSTISVNAPKARVWAALTRPELVKQWQYGTDLTTTWEPGSRISFRSEWQGQVFEQWGSVIEFLPPERLSYSLFFPRPDLKDSPENYFRMTYRLEEQEDGAVLVTIIQEDPRPVAPDAAPEDPDAANSVLQALKTVAEAG